MPAPLAIAAFFTIWWVSLFAVLPFVLRWRSDPEGAEDAPSGVDPGAPAAPRVLRTALWTTLVAAVIFAALDAYVVWSG
jgi:predicted secreted protein